LKIIQVLLGKSSGVIVLSFLLLTQIFSSIIMNFATADSVTSTMHETVDIFEGRFSSQEISLIPNQVMDLSFSICPIIDAPNTVIRFIMPADLVTLVKGQQTWEGDVKQRETLTLDFSIVAIEEVDAHVRVDVESSFEDANFKSSFYLHVTTLTIMPNLESSEGIQLPARQLDSSLSNEGSLASAVESSDGTITIKGRWSYTNEDGDLSPMRSVRVYLMDEDTGPDDTVASQYTNYNGEFSFTVDNDDGLLQGGRDPYVKVYSEGGVADCKSDGGSWYVGELPKCGDDVPDGFYYDYGHWSLSSDAWVILDACLEERDWVYFRGGQNWQRSSKVDVRWPTNDGPYSTGNGIHMPSKTTKAWDRFTVYHEYGHCVMYALYGHFPSGSGPSPHYVVSESSGGFAISEGWAEFMEAAVENDPSRLADVGQNIETNDWYNYYDSTDMDGDIVEGSVASILWDIYDYYDTSDKDDMYFQFEEIFTVMRYDQPDNMHQFWNDWIVRWPDMASSVGPLSTVYWHYGIDKDFYAPYSGSVLINDGDTYCTSTLVTLTLTCNDYGSGPRYMRIRNNASGSWSQWEDYDSSPNWLLYYTGDGTKPIYVQFQDKKGYVSAVHSDTIILDRKKPTGSISIEAGASSTEETVVTLWIWFGDDTSGVDKIRFQNEGEPWSEWEYPPEGIVHITWGYARSGWTLSPGDGTKTVYYQIKDKAGLVSITYSDSITLDTSPELSLDETGNWYWNDDTVINSVVKGDVDDDGDVEVVTGGSYFDGVHDVAQLCVWDGATLALENVQTWYWYSHTRINSVAIGDVDGDGAMEIVTGGYFDDGTRFVAQLCVWNGATLALENVRTWYWTDDTYINSVAVGDVDGDGAMEIVTGGRYNDGTRDVAQLCVWDGATLALENVRTWYWTDDTYINSVAVGDVDGDDSVEIVTGGSYYIGPLPAYTNTVAQLCVWNGATLTLENVKTWYSSSNYYIHTYVESVAVGDVDGDGKMEIVTGGNYVTYGVKLFPSTAQLIVWSGDSLAVEETQTWVSDAFTYINSVGFGDVDGDSNMEIVTGGHCRGWAYPPVQPFYDVAEVHVWDGDSLAQESVQCWQWTYDTDVNSVAVGDVNGDGAREIVTGGSYFDGARNVAQLCVWS
jgi:hypothetical protein